MKFSAYILFVFLLSCNKANLHVPGVLVSGAGTFAFSQESFSIDENGVAVGVPVTITRLGNMKAQSISITGQTITNDALEVDLTTQVIDFEIGENSKTVTFTLGADGAFKGDRFFKATLSAPTNAGVLGDRVEAVVNLLENEVTPGKFFFPQPLYTVSENGTSVAIRIQRSGSTATMETVQLATMNGSASGPVDFNNSSQIITFNAGVSEVTAHISIVDNAVASDSKSFFIELKNPVALGALVTRPWSTAKVRILDNDEVDTCDPLLTLTFGGGTGVLGDPYLICNLSQLSLVATNLDKNFKVTKDLDVEGLVPAVGIFTGVFDGNERVLKNFRYATVNGVAAMFDEIGDASGLAEISKVNLTQVKLTSTNDSAVGIVTWASDSYKTLSSNLVSGSLTAGDTAGGILGRSTGTQTNPLKYNFAHGVIEADSYGGGILSFVQNLNDPSAIIENSYSTANYRGDGYLGGIIGCFSYAHTPVSITSSQSKGYFTIDGASSNYMGGIIGAIFNNPTADVTLNDNLFEGSLKGSEHVGGISGEFNCYNLGVSCNVNRNTVRALVSGRGFVGGMFGRVDGDRTLTVSDNYVDVRMSDTQNSITAGLVGRMDYYGSDTITFQNNMVASTSTFTSAFNGEKGGLIGRLFINETPTFLLKGSTIDVDISAPNSDSVSGIMGGLLYGQATDDTQAQITIEDMTFIGNIVGKRGVGGAIGTVGIWDNTGAGSSLIMNDISMTGNFTSTRETGGIIGSADIGGGNVVQLTGMVVAGNGTTDDSYVGGVFGTLTIEPGADIGVASSSFKGDLTATVWGAGGLVGEVNCTGGGTLTVDKSFANGTMTADEDVGGLIGGFENTGCFLTVTDSYSRGKVVAADWGAGLVGYYQEPQLFQNSYSSSEILVAGTNVDGLATLWTGGVATFTDCFYKQDAAFNVGIPGSNPRTDAQLKVQGNFTNWDFTPVTGVWEFGGAAYLYPTLIGL